MTEAEKAERHELEQESARGDRIRAFLEDSLVKGVLQSLELSYYRAWKLAATPAEREKLHAQVSAFDDLRDSLQGIVASGERATLELIDLERVTD